MNKKIKSLLEKFIPAGFQPRLKGLYVKLYYFGFTYKCPFCKSHLRKLLPFGYEFPVLKEKRIVGGFHRENSACPICGSFDRERLLYLYLLHKTDLFRKPHKLLHVAPEIRLKNTLIAKRNIDYLAADLCPDPVMVKVDLTDIQFPDGSFDAIICCHVLEHIIDDRKAMAELYRVLKPGAWAILQVPMSLALDKTFEDFSITTTEGREKAFGQSDHVRIYAKDYTTRLEQAGFTLTLFRWHSEPSQFGGRKNKYSLYEDECVYFVAKPPINVAQTSIRGTDIVGSAS
jgi:SAM-dependent methyltransferase